MSKGWNPITPDEIIIGPIEDEEMLYNIIEYMDNLEAREGSIESHFKSNSDA